MISFKDKKKNLIKHAYSIENDKNNDENIIIKFSENGKEYKYNKNNIEFIENDNTSFIIYKYDCECYKCKKETTIYTYIKFDNGEDLIYPWDKHRLNKEKSLEASLAHMQYEKIEFYPINVIGSDDKFDQILLKKFPNNIKNKYSVTQKRSYPMNICKNCGAKQGEFFIYEELNKKIYKMENIDIYKEKEE